MFPRVNGKMSVTTSLFAQDFTHGCPNTVWSVLSSRTVGVPRLRIFSEIRRGADKTTNSVREAIALQRNTRGSVCVSGDPRIFDLKSCQARVVYFRSALSAHGERRPRSVGINRASRRVW
jgi:hypothetical protein